jgi:chromosome segregation ATPase
MSDGQLHQAPDMANGSVLNKTAVEAQMNRLEAMDISPSVQAVRAHMGGATARVGALVTEINGERDAVVEAAITEELSKTAKKLHHLARDSAKRVFAADLRVMSSEIERIKVDHNQANGKVKELSSDLQAVSVDRAAKEQLLAMEVDAHQATKKELAAMASQYALLKLENEHMSLQLAQSEDKVIAIQRDKQAAEDEVIQLQRQVEHLTESLQGERVGRQSASELLEREIKAHQSTQAAKADSKEDLAVARSELLRVRSEQAQAQEEVEQLKRSLLAEQERAQLNQEREGTQTRANGALLAQLELLIERVRSIAPDVAKEFEIVLERSRK